MYLLLFYTHVQTTTGGNNTIKYEICFRVKNNYTAFELEIKSKKNISKISNALLKN